MKKFLFVSTILATLAACAFAAPATAYDKAKEAGKAKWYNCTWFPTAFMTEPVSDTISVDSIPSGAEVVVNGESKGTTPIVLEYPRKKAPVVVLKKDGYPDQQLRIRRKLNKTAVIDGIVTIIPFTVLVTWQDWAYNVGSMLEYSEKNVVVELQKFDDGKPVCPSAYGRNVELRPAGK